MVPVRRSILAALLTVSLAGEVVARGKPKPTLERARNLVEKQLRYEDGIREVRRLLRRGELGERDRVEAFWLLGVAYVARGNSDSAEAAFWELLRLAPDHEVDPMVSPKVQEVFERVRGKRVTAPRIAALDARRTTSGLRFDARFEDEQNRLTALRLAYRLDDSEFRVVPMTLASGEASARVELSSEVLLSPSWRVEFFVVGHGADGESVVRLGSAEAASVVILDRVTERVVVPAEEPWYGRWWLWAAVGAAVVAATTTAVVLTTDSSCTGPDGTLAPICL